MPQLCNYRVKHEIEGRTYREEDIVLEDEKLYYISRNALGDGNRVLLSDSPGEIEALQNILPDNMDLVDLEQQNTGNCYFLSAIAGALKHEDPRYLDKLLQSLSFDSNTKEYLVTIPSYKEHSQKIVRVPKHKVDNYVDPQGNRPANSNAKFTVLMELASLEYAQETGWSRDSGDDSFDPNSLSYTNAGWLMDGLRVSMPEGSEIKEDMYVGGLVMLRRHLLMKPEMSTLMLSLTLGFKCLAVVAMLYNL